MIRFLLPASMVLLLCLPACSRPTEEGLVRSPLSDSLFVELTIELHIASARIQRLNDRSPSIRDSIFAHFGVTSQEYEAAVAYYGAHPQEYLDRYNQALDRINVERFLRTEDEE